MTSLFAWQRAVISSTLPASTQLAALRIALDSSQATGLDIVVNATQVAHDLGCSERTVWRRLEVLIGAGWLSQTVKPTYGGAAGKGRRARYTLSQPAQSSVTDSVPLAHDSCDTVCHEEPDLDTRPSESSATARGKLANDNPSRVPDRDPSSATTAVTGGTLSASDGSSNSSSCSDVAIDILASKLRLLAPLASLRTDKLKPDQAATIRDLIAVHGDQKLVDNATRTLRPADPPQTIQAFLPGWRVMPKPGDPHLAAVPDPPCALPGHSGTTRHCTQCASERKAAR